MVTDFSVQCSMLLFPGASICVHVPSHNNELLNLGGAAVKCLSAVSAVAMRLRTRQPQTSRVLQHPSCFRRSPNVLHSAAARHETVLYCTSAHTVNPQSRSDGGHRVAVLDRSLAGLHAIQDLVRVRSEHRLLERSGWEQNFEDCLWCCDGGLLRVAWRNLLN